MTKLGDTDERIDRDQTYEGYVPVSVAMIGPDFDLEDICVDHESAPWMYSDGKQEDVWAHVPVLSHINEDVEDVQIWTDDDPTIEAAIAWVHKANLALKGLAKIHADYRLGFDNGDGGPSGADLRWELYELMGQIGLEVE